MSTVNHKSSELAVFLQAVSSLELQLEKKRLALNLLQFYSSDIAFKLLSEFSEDGMISQSDITGFLNDWHVDTCSTEIRGLFLDFCQIRSVMDYSSYLYMTVPAAYLDKQPSNLTVQSLSEEVRFKLESAIVLFLMKELKFQRDIEKRRLALLDCKRFDIQELFHSIDSNSKGYLKFEDLIQFLETYDLHFDTNAWAALLFRAKKKRCINTTKEKLTFTDFHDLIYPVTFFEQLMQRDMDECLHYLDKQEQGYVTKLDLKSKARTTVHTPVKDNKASDSQETGKFGTTKKINSQITTKAHSGIKPSQQNTAERPKTKKSPQKDFLSPFYQVSEDGLKMMNLTINSDIFETDSVYHDGVIDRSQLRYTNRETTPSKSLSYSLTSREMTPTKDTSIKEGKNKTADRQSTSGDAWIHYNRDYSTVYGHKTLPSKFVRYYMTLKAAADLMYA